MLNKNEIEVISNKEMKTELQRCCEYNLMQAADILSKDEALANSINKNSNGPVFSADTDGVKCNIYAIKPDDTILLLSEAQKDALLVRLYLRLVWQEDKNKWIPHHYEI